MSPKRPLEASGASLGAPWAPRRVGHKPRQGHLNRFGSLFGRPRGVQGPSGRALGPSWATFGRLRGRFYEPKRRTPKK